jgi:hypothetical protein
MMAKMPKSAGNRIRAKYILKKNPMPLNDNFSAALQNILFAAFVFKLSSFIIFGFYQIV